MQAGICPKCGNEMWVDHINSEGYIYYTCMDPQCENYRKCETPSGDKEDTQIH